MIPIPLWTLLPLLLGLFAGPAPGQQAVVTRLVVQDQLILRIPVRPRPLLPPAFEWAEGKGPKCIPTSAIRGAMLSGPGQVDFVLVDRQRLRAKLSEDCPALDFYSGFYLQSEDQRLCVRRDMIFSRMGGSCRIERFNQLAPKLRH